MEVLSLLDVSSSQIKLAKLDKRYYLLETACNVNIKNLRLAISAKSIYNVLGFSSSIDQLLKTVRPVDQFYLDVYPRSKLDKRSLALRWESIHGVRGSIREPRKVYYIFAFPDGFYLAEKLFETERRACLLRGPKYRPFKRSGILNSELARLMVNLGKVLPGTSILDPFCGSGSILIEAYYNGAAKIVGIDIDARMLEGAKENFRFLGIEADKDPRIELIRGDCRQVLANYPPGSFDAVVTDPPYGRSTKATEEIPRLLRNCFQQALRLLRPGGRLVFVVPREMKLSWILPEEAKVIYVSDFYVHKSLTRRLVVLEK